MEKDPVRKAFVIVNGADIFPLKKKITNIGRMEDNDIVLANAHVSRYHAQLRGEGEQYTLVDLESTSGTSINGSRVTESPLTPGDVISIAGIPIIFGLTAGSERLDQNAPTRPTRAPGAPPVEPTDSIELSDIDSYLNLFEETDDDRNESQGAGHD